MSEADRIQEAINWLKIDRDSLEFPLSSQDALNRDYVESRARVLDTALSSLRAQEQNDPLTCDGCRFHPVKYDFLNCIISRCENCSRGNILLDRYEPKHAPDERSDT